LKRPVLAAVAGFAVLGMTAAGAYVIVSPGGEEEAVQQADSPTPSPAGTPTLAPSGTPQSSTSPTPPSPTPQASPGPLSMEGPTEASPGEILTYRLSYTFPDGRGSGIIIGIPRNIQYVSSQLTAGEGRMTKEADAESIDLRWLLIGTGVLEITVRVPDSTTSGTIVMGASGPGGSGIPPNEQIASNIVTTTVSGP